MLLPDLLHLPLHYLVVVWHSFIRDRALSIIVVVVLLGLRLLSEAHLLWSSLIRVNR